MRIEDCRLKKYCKKGVCDFTCYPFTVLYGVDGQTGLWKKRNVPKKYDNCFLDTLPKLEPSHTDEKMRSYIGKVFDLVKKGIGLYLFSVPNENNTLGTGNGKTTVATTILNEYLIQRVISYTKGDSLTSSPVLFVEMADFQNIYNSQFRGNFQSQEQASEVFYRYKHRMKQVELLVIDDLAIRNITEAFMNEFYEVVNHRVNEDLATIYTSNEPLHNLTEIFGERIISRIEGSTALYPFTGKDHRRKGWG